ncbi:MAG: feruloyl-CoA synthase, partial [Saccharospirillum sp.]
RIIDAGAPVVQDVVIAGLDRAFVSALVFPEREQCRLLAGLDADAEIDDVVKHPVVIERFKQLLRDLKASSTGSSNRVERLVLLTELPRLDAHEITDKGSINQRAVLENRAKVVDEIYQSIPSAAVMTLTD